MRRWLWDNRGYRDIWLLIITGVVVWAIVVALGSADESHRSLCTLRAERAQSVARAEKFLEKHPQGGFGFTRLEILKSIHDQKVTVLAFSGLSCPPPPKS